MLKKKKKKEEKSVSNPMGSFLFRFCITNQETVRSALSRRPFLLDGFTILASSRFSGFQIWRLQGPWRLHVSWKVYAFWRLHVTWRLRGPWLQYRLSSHQRDRFNEVLKKIWRISFDKKLPKHTDMSDSIMISHHYWSQQYKNRWRQTTYAIYPALCVYDTVQD